MRKKEERGQMAASEGITWGREESGGCGERREREMGGEQRREEREGFQSGERRD